MEKLCCHAAICAIGAYFCKKKNIEFVSIAFFLILKKKTKKKNIKQKITKKNIKHKIQKKNIKHKITKQNKLQ